MDEHSRPPVPDGPVVVGTDGSDVATRAVMWAAEEATARGRPLQILCATHVDLLPDELTEDVIRPILDTAADRADTAARKATGRFPGLQVTTSTSRGDPAESLVEAAGARGTVVVGSRGLGGFSSLLLGSVGRQVTRWATGPVVVVRGEPRTPAVTVLVGARDSRDILPVRFAALYAQRRDAALRVLGAWTLTHHLESMAPMVASVRAVAERQADRTAPLVAAVREEYPNLRVAEEVVRVPSAAGALVAQSAHVDLVVLGSRDATGPLSAPVGRVAQAVLEHAACPVALVPRG
ncbi:universal stress protein [Actinacidiphila glaucinigra]|uniref:universal stress protein n=1 Tax=Actinacidiphila glaucinigra TaxID=235986 RepID=UPI00379C0C56